MLNEIYPKLLTVKQFCKEFTAFTQGTIRALILMLKTMDLIRLLLEFAQLVAEVEF